MEALTTDFFSAVPYSDPNKVLQLRELYQHRIIANAVRIIEYLEAEFDTELSDFTNALTRIDVSRRLSSQFHHFSVVLESAYANKKTDDMIAILDAYSSLEPEELYGAELRYDTFFTESYDQKVIKILEDQPGVRAIYGKNPEVFPLDDGELKVFSKYSKQAVSLIEELDPDFYHEIAAYIDKIRLFKGQIVTGISSILTFGTLYLRVPNNDTDPLAYFIDHFTHETSHHHLHALMGFDPLILNGPEELYVAPIRRDMRPMYGIYHATFVLSRICRLLGRLNERFEGKFEGHLTKVRKQFALGADTVANHGKLTEMGKQILNTCIATAELDVTATQ